MRCIDIFSVIDGKVPRLDIGGPPLAATMPGAGTR